MSDKIMITYDGSKYYSLLVNGDIVLSKCLEITGLNKYGIGFFKDKDYKIGLYDKNGEIIRKGLELYFHTFSSKSPEEKISKMFNIIDINSEKKYIILKDNGKFTILLNDGTFLVENAILIEIIKNNIIKIKKENNKLKCIDFDGNVFFDDLDVDDLFSYSEGFFIFIDKDEFGWVSKNGKILTNETFYKCEKFRNGYAIFEEKIDDKKYFGIVDKDGNILFRGKEFSYINNFSKDGIAVVYLKNKKNGWVNKNGEIIREFDKEYCEDFYNGIGISVLEKEEKTKDGYTERVCSWFDINGKKLGSLEVAILDSFDEKGISYFDIYENNNFYDDYNILEEYNEETLKENKEKYKKLLKGKDINIKNLIENNIYHGYVDINGKIYIEYPYI